MRIENIHGVLDIRKRQTTGPHTPSAQIVIGEKAIYVSIARNYSVSKQSFSTNQATDT